MKALLRRIRQILKDRRTRRFLTRFVSGIAAVVVFVTTYALVLPAITMESEAACGIEAHQHDDSCYTENLICGQEESEGHHHTDDCFTVTMELECDLEEHQHSLENGCFDEEGNLVCKVEEHTHSDSCYQEHRELTCGLEETEGHHHTDSCYEKVLSCGKEVHTHSTSCYKADLKIESAAVTSTGMTSAAAVPNLSDEDIYSEEPEHSQDDPAANEALDEQDQTDEDEEHTDKERADEDAENGDAYIPEKEELDFNTVLNSRTGIYYHHVAEDEEIEDSSAISDWDKADEDTELNRADLIRMYLSYTLPRDTVNATNDIARYRLPDSLHLTDEQVDAINECENGISSQYIEYDSLEITDVERHTAYLGLESVEGTRRPGEEPEEDDQEYISATVKAEKIYDEETGEYEGTDLIFTFSPYTVEKNAHAYDKKGQPTRAGEEVTGWLTLDFNMGQIDWAEDNTSEIIFAEEDRENKVSEISTVLKQADPSQAEDDDLAAAGMTEAAAEDMTADEDAADAATETAAADETAETAAQDATEEAAAADVTAEETAAADNTVDKAEEAGTEKTAAEAPDDEKDKKEESVAAGYPAAVFDDSITVRSGRLDSDLDDTDIPKKTKMTVHVEADEGTFPEGTRMVLSAVEDLDAVAEAVGTAIDVKTRGFQAVDITFYDKDPSEEDAKEIEPLKPIRVSIKSDEIKKAAEDSSTAPVVVHIEDNNTATEVESTASKTDSASIEIEKPGVEGEMTAPDNDSANNEDESKDAANKAGDNKNSENKAAEDKDREDAANEDAADESTEGVTGKNDAGEETDPAADNSTEGVTGTNDAGEETDSAADNSTEGMTGTNDAGEETDPAADDSSEGVTGTVDAAAGDAVTFEADTFSIYAVVYTVDFEYNGYMISIPGNASVLLSKLAEELGMGRETAEGPVFDINNVASVSFSNETLVRVSRIAEKMTVSELLAGMEQDGVQTWLAQNVVVRSEEKSDEEILAEADAVEPMDEDVRVEAGDWVLTGLQAFHTDEELLITMKTGEQYVISVTDLDTGTNGVKPSTVPGYDSASAGIKITMFDYGPDKLDNVNNTYNSTDNSGINSGHKLKFYSYGTEGSTMNNFTGGAYAMQGIVKTELVDGYPVTNNGENLSYLFNETPSGNNKKVYENVNGLFRYNDSTGLMHYSSDENYAYMNPTPNSSGGYDFKLYSNTYTEEGADYANPFRIGFFPYNDYDNRYRCIHGDNFRWGCKGQNDRRVRDQVGHYNHHFGMKVEGNFYMTDDKKTPIGNQDMIFEFSGDDDMWVFIDGVLVLDIGGIHNPVDGKINFTTGQVTVSAAKTASGGSSYALGTNTTIANAFAKAGKTWDDSPLSQHEIKIFYMERGGMYSNLEISMNLPTFPEPKHVDLWKVNQENAKEKLAGAKFELYSDFACSKPIKATGSDAPVIISSVTVPLGRVQIENLVPGQIYYLKEIQAPEGYKLDNRVFKIVAPANNDSSEAQIYLATSETEAEPLSDTNITNVKDKYGSFDFFKVKEGEPDTKLSGAQFTLYTDMDCTTIAKNKAGQNLQTTSGNNGKLSFSDIPAGKTYYMKETAEPAEYFPSGDVYTVEVDADGNVTVKLGGEVKFTSASNDSARQITNKPKAEKTSISVDKRWEDGAANHTNDTVTVQLYKLETNTTTVNVDWGGKNPGDDARVTVTFSANGCDDVTVELNNTGWSKPVDLVAGVAYNVTYTSSGEKVENVTGAETFTAAPNGTYTLTGTLKATKIDVPVSVEWTGGAPAAGTTVTVTIKDDAGVESERQITLTGGDNWNSSVELTEGKTYSVSYSHSGDGNIASVTGTTSLTVVSGSKIAATGTIGNGKMNLTVVYVTNKQGHTYVPYGSAPHSFIRRLDGNNDYINPTIQAISENEYIISDLEVESSGKVYSYYFTPNPGYQDPYTISSTNELGANKTTFYGNTVVSFEAKPGNYTIYILDAGMSAPTSFAHTPSSMRSSGRSARNAPLRSAVPADNFLNGTHKLPAGAAPEGAPVVLNQNHDGKWSHTWTDLVSESNGTKTTYYVVETAVDLANGDNNDVVSSTYEYVYNVDGDESSGIKTVIVTNTVQPKTSLEVTKKWLNADNSQAEDSEDIIFEVHQVVGDRDTVYPDSQTTHTITYNTAENKYGTVEIQNLPTRVKVGNELKDAKYYVVEISPAGGDDLTTYYEADGKQYADPADAAGATAETIVNKNVSREITVTKEWRYKNGSRVTAPDVPPEMDVYFKLKKIVDGQDADYFTAGSTAGIPESNISQDGYVPYSNAGDNGTIYHLICTSTTTEHQSELDPAHTYSTTSWTWNTLTFKDLPTGCKYVMVETDSEGNELLSDAVGTQITYVDENGKLINESRPIDPAIPGNYTIRNTEHRISLYAQKVWHGANKDNLTGNEPVWFSLMRVETDGNGNYDLNTLEETPGVGRFSLKESSGWVKYFDSIEVAPPERHANDTFKYYQYFIVELGLLDQSTANMSDAEKTYSLINNLFIKYQSKGSGTAADGSVADDRAEFKPYSQCVDLAADDHVTGSQTVGAWIDRLKTDTVLASGFLNNDMIRLRTWESSYDGMGTLGAFNSSQEFLHKPLAISKVWKDANGNDLSPEENAQINATGEGDHYQVEIQLMQHAYNLTGKDSSVTYDVPYGSTFMVDPEKVVMQSDMFEVMKEGASLWKYEIPAQNSEGENQLPVIGPFRIPGSAETVQAHFEYYVSEYRVYNNEGNDVTTLWSAACVKNTSGDTYSLQLENRKTTDLVLHKKWENVPEETRTWVDNNIQAVLFKVWRKAQSETDAADITEYIAARPTAYGLAASNVFDVELDGVYEDFVRIDKPEGGWAITDTGSADAVVTIGNLDALVKDYISNGDLSGWPKYQYWVEEWGYVDADGSFQYVESLLHGNTKDSADYPRYQKSTGSATVSLTDGGTAGYGSSGANARKPAETTIGKSEEINLGAAGQNHLGVVNTVRGLELTILKTDNAAIPKKLTGVQFKITRKDAEGSWKPFIYMADVDADAETADVKVETDDGKFIVTAENGYIIKNLMPGQYKLEEVKAPDGYIFQFSPLDFEVTLEGKVVTPGTTTELTGGADEHFTYSAGTTAGKTSGTIAVQNEPGAALPYTGGPGTKLFTILGSILILGAGVLLWRRRRLI